MVSNHSTCTVTFPDGSILADGDTYFGDTQPLLLFASGNAITVAHLQPQLLAPRLAPRPTLVAPVARPLLLSGVPPRPRMPPPMRGLPAWALQGSTGTGASEEEEEDEAGEEGPPSEAVVALDTATTREVQGGGVDTEGPPT